MIIGSGMLAKSFGNYDNYHNDVIFFASGVSNSKENNQLEFEREKKLLLEYLNLSDEKKFIYLSTCSLYDSTQTNSHYVHHKMNMERLVREHSNNYLIARLPQVVGKTNSPTLINYIHSKILNNEAFSIWHKSARNLIDVEDVSRVINYILLNNLFQNETINIASEEYTKIYEIVALLERIIGKRANFEVLDYGSSYFIDVSKMKYCYENLGIKFDNHYVLNMLKRYYSNEKL